MTAEFSVISQTERLRGSVFAVVTDEVRMPDGTVGTRDYIKDHLGAVAVVPYHTATGQVLLIRQYRHPMGRQMWELPAGLLDVAGETPVTAAARELAEEADLIADDYHVLADLAASPGISDEVIRIFLARELRPVPEADRHVRTHEESAMTTQWFSLDDAVAACLAGEVENATCVAGLLAAARCRDNYWTGLRAADAVWPARG